MDPHEFKEKLEIPAYKRRNITARIAGDEIQNGFHEMDLPVHVQTIPYCHN